VAFLGAVVEETGHWSTTRHALRCTVCQSD
jgi:hypothetical protein